MTLSPLYPLLATSLILSACAGGGGGGSSSSGVSPFTAWSAVAPNSSISLTGISATPTAVGPDISSNASATATFDANRNLTAMTLSAGSGASASFNVANGDIISGNVSNASVIAINKQGQGAIIVNPYAAGFEYQTFGSWSSFAGGPQAANVNTVSLGSPTPVTGMPAVGSAIFSGYASGLYFQGAAGYFTASTMNAGVDFGSRTIAFATGSTIATGSLGGTLVSAPALNMTGLAGFSAGTNKFAGVVTTAGGMSGPLGGQFYGPNANEIGGTFYASGTGAQGYYVGSFGGKR